MPDRAIELVVEAGKALLENGGEVFRAQSTMEIMARSLGIDSFHVYVLTNGIFASALVDGVPHSAVRHIPTVSIHLGRVEAVNALSRRMAAGELDLDGAEAALRQAKALPGYGPRLECLAGGVGSAGFGFLFGGFLPEIFVAFLAGICEQLVVQGFRRRGISRIFTDLVAAALCTAVALAARAVYPPLNADTAIIGALMVLTPGVALTMGIRDFINADYLSGTIRLFDALLVAGCLAGGVAISYSIAYNFLGVLL